MTSDQTKLFDLWFFLDESLENELEYVALCRRMRLEESLECQMKIQLYRTLLKRLDVDFTRLA
jgi:hypothetical protein